MSALALVEKSESLIKAQAKSFVDLAKSHKAVNFEQEAHFAIQALKSNSFLAKVAAENPDSLISAVHNIASVGLSLNPALKHAYLVPRDGKVCLDFGYKGLVHLALETGGTRYVQAELVYTKDKFALKSRGEEPLHERDPFDTERGEVRGAWRRQKRQDGLGHAGLQPAGRGRQRRRRHGRQGPQAGRCGRPATRAAAAGAVGAAAVHAGGPAGRLNQARSMRAAKQPRLAKWACR